METGGSRKVTDRQIARLSAAIGGDKMESIGIRYMGFSGPTMENFKRDTSDSEAFIRRIFRSWANNNEVEDQVQVIMNL